MGKTKQTANLVSNGFLTPNGAGIGIGSDIPSSKLDVLGDVKITGISTLSNVIVGAGLSVVGVSTFASNIVLTGAGQSIGIGTASPRVAIDVSETTNAISLPQGTTAQRPTGSAPYIRKNTTNNALEYYDGTSWVEIITDYFPTGSTILG